MIRAVIYCRCSTEEECQRDALIRQAAEARECVRRLNWSLEDEYIESRSGTSTRGRVEYQRLFADLLRDKFEIVVIKSQDRLMRNTRDWYTFIDRLVTQGKRLYLYLEKRFYSTDDALLTGIKAILSEEYSRELSRKINNAHRNRQRTGSALMLTSNTYGYRKMPDKNFTIVEAEAEVKRKMYELCAAGYGSRTIARILREKGVKKRNGNYFSDSDIRRMIRNPINKGTVVMNRKHYDFDTRRIVNNQEEQFYVYKNRIPAIVSEELWEAANREIDKRRSNASGRCMESGINRGKYALSGKLVCGLCGAPFYRTTRRRKYDKVHEWKCRTYLEQGRIKENRQGGCENIHLKEKTLFSLLESCCVSRSGETSVIATFLGIFESCLEELKDKKQENYKQFEKKIKYQQKLLLDKYLEGIVEEPLYLEKNRGLERKLKACAHKTGEEVKNSLCSSENSQGNSGQKKEIKERIRETEQFLNQNNSFSKACILCVLEQIDKIIIYPDHLEVTGKAGKCIIAADTSDMLY